MYATVVDKLDARPGGLWRFLNRDAGGKEYAFHQRVSQGDGSERIVATFEFEGAPGHVWMETLNLEEIGGRTVLTNTSVLQSVADRDAMLRHGMEEGAVETMDRLAELLAHDVAEEKRHREGSVFDMMSFDEHRGRARKGACSRTA